METLEQQFEKALDTITLEGSGQKLMDTEIIHSCLVNNDFAKITLILPEDSSLRKNLPDQVEKVIQNLNGIERVAVEVLANPPPDEEKTEPQQPQDHICREPCGLDVALTGGPDPQQWVSLW